MSYTKFLYLFKFNKFPFLIVYILISKSKDFVFS